MSKIKLLSIGVIGLLVLNLGLLGFLFFKQTPARDNHQRPEDGGGPKKIIIQKLHFDQQQTSSYEKLVNIHHETIMDLDEQIRETKNNLYATLTDTTRGLKDSLMNSLIMLHAKIERVHYDHFIDIKKLCRPEQLDDFNSLALELARLFSPKRNPPPRPQD